MDTQSTQIRIYNISSIIILVQCVCDHVCMCVCVALCERKGEWEDCERTLIIQLHTCQNIDKGAEEGERERGKAKKRESGVKYAKLQRTVVLFRER